MLEVSLGEDLHGHVLFFKRNHKFLQLINDLIGSFKEIPSVHNPLTSR